MKVNTVGYFEIQSSNPERDKEFYSSLFNWAFIKKKIALSSITELKPTL
jgi:predicted enzyme related to lactoylglutathione lyase